MSDSRKLLPSGKNAIGLVIGLLLGFAFWSWWNAGTRSARAPERAQASTPAKGELDLVEYAVRRARSWRVTTAGTSNGQRFQTDQDVFCPYQSHTVTYTKGGSGENTLQEEFIETEDSLYARQGNDPWSSQPRTPSDKCATGPMAGPEPLLTIVGRFKAATSVRKSAIVQFQGNSCRVWDLISNDTKARVGDLCVDDLTHLPYEFRSGMLQVEYSNWNQPVLIAAPEVHSSIPPQ